MRSHVLFLTATALLTSGSLALADEPTPAPTPTPPVAPVAAPEMPPPSAPVAIDPPATAPPAETTEGHHGEGHHGEGHHGEGHHGEGHHGEGHHGEGHHGEGHHGEGHPGDGHAGWHHGGGGPDNSALAHDGHPLAGYHNGLWYLRDYHDNYRLYIQGRAHIDGYTYFGPGVSQTGTNGIGAPLKPTLFLRRIRPEVTGEFFHHWWFSIAGEFGATVNDNPAGNATESSAAAPGTAPSNATGRYAAAQTPRITAQATDVWVNYRPTQLVNFQMGQFDAPFTLENRTSDKFIPFMERSLAVRAVGVPTNKEIGLMAWGEPKNGLFYYSLGLFNGDGQNRLNTDASGDVMSRVFVHPLHTRHDVLKDLHVGASVRYGNRDSKYSNFDYPAMTTQGNSTFWNPSYKGTAGTGTSGWTHVLPSGKQLGVAGELRIPVDRFDLTSELVYISNNTREALEGYQALNTERLGEMKGYSYYVMATMWIGQRDIGGLPGYENMPRVDFRKADPAHRPYGVQLVAKWEQVALNYSGASRDGIADAKGIDGDIKVNAFSLGANAFVSRHLRLTVNYVLNSFPDSAPSGSQTSAQRAVAPGNTLAAGVNDDARANAHVLHELLFRVAVGL